MKKCVVIHGSARRGNTFKATRMLMENLKQMGAVEFDEIFLHDLKLPFCRGCFLCIEKDEKLCKDSAIVADLEARILASDALILGAPIYILQINAETKNLLDHFAFRFHRPKFFDKKAMVITTTAGAGAKSGTKFMKNTLLFLGFSKVHCLPITCQSDVLPDTQKIKDQIRRSSEAFFKDLYSSSLPSPGLYQMAIYNVFRVNAEHGKKRDSCDYKYWKQMGMIDKVHINRAALPMRLLGGIIHGILKKVVPS